MNRRSFLETLVGGSAATAVGCSKKTPEPDTYNSYATNDESVKLLREFLANPVIVTYEIDTMVRENFLKFVDPEILKLVENCGKCQEGLECPCKIRRAIEKHL